MSDDTEPGGLDPRAAERLLDGSGGHAELRELLAAASAPGLPRELAGEDAAVAAFLAAPRPARRSRAAALRRFLTVKVIAVVGGSVLLSGGVAFATGNFPGQDAAPAPSSTPHDRETRGRGSGSGTHPLHRTPTGPSPTPSRDEGKNAGEPGEHGRTSAPGQQKKTASPKAKPTPPRGPGNNNGTTRPTTPSKKNSPQGNGATNGAPKNGNQGGGPQTGVPLLGNGDNGR